MRHVNDQPDLACVTAFPAEIRACDDVYSVSRIRCSVVWNEVPINNDFLQWMSPVCDVDTVLIRGDNVGTNVLQVVCAARERKDAIQVREGVECFTKFILAFKYIILKLSDDQELSILDAGIQVADGVIEIRNVWIFEIREVFLVEDIFKVFW